MSAIKLWSGEEVEITYTQYLKLVPVIDDKAVDTIDIDGYGKIKRTSISALIEGDVPSTTLGMTPEQLAKLAHEHELKIRAEMPEMEE